MGKNKTRILTECGILVALSVLLSYIPLFEMPMGGSITLCSMAPLLMVSYRHGARWGVLTGAVHGLISMILGFKNVLYCTTILAMAGCILLDYIIAYAMMGTACIFAAGFKNRAAGVAVGTVVTGALRYFCSFVSGILIWGGYAPEGTPVWLYSLEYNGSYMIPEIIITAVVMVIIVRLFEKKLFTQNTAAN